MTLPEPCELRCHHCTHALRGTKYPAVFVGMFKPIGQRVYVGPGDTYRCKGCGWVNVFQPPAERRDAA